jgi:hypothetical protein
VLLSYTASGVVQRTNVYATMLIALWLKRPSCHGTLEAQLHLPRGAWLWQSRSGCLCWAIAVTGGATMVASQGHKRHLGSAGAHSKARPYPLLDLGMSETKSNYIFSCRCIWAMFLPSFVYHLYM